MLHRLVGRRGVVLLTLAAVWVLFGLSIATYTPPQDARTGRFNIAFADHPAWAAVWIVCGIVAGAYAVRRRWGGNDTIGWIAGITPPMVWTTLYAISFLWACTTDGAIGAERGWVGFVSWVLVVGLVRVIAGWEDGLHAPIAGEVR